MELASRRLDDRLLEATRLLDEGRAAMQVCERELTSLRLSQGL
jgi:hypothetical protein